MITLEGRGRAAVSKCQCRRPEWKVSSSRGWRASARLISWSPGCLAASQSQSAAETSRRFQPKVSSDVGVVRENVFSDSQWFQNRHNLTCLLWIQERAAPVSLEEPQKKMRIHWKKERKIRAGGFSSVDANPAARWQTGQSPPDLAYSFPKNLLMNPEENVPSGVLRWVVGASRLIANF